MGQGWNARSLSTEYAMSQNLATTPTAVTSDVNSTVTGIALVLNASGASFNQPVAKTTIADGTNPQAGRYFALTDAGLTFVRAGTTCAIAKADLISLFVGLVPALTWPPILTANPAATSAVHNSTTGNFGATFISELSGTYVWQYSPDNSTWTDFSGSNPTHFAETNYIGSFSAGTTTLTTTGTPTGLVVTPGSSWVAGDGSLYVRIVLTNSQGSTNSASARLTVT